MTASEATADNKSASAPEPKPTPHEPGPAKPAIVRVIITSILFLAWMGYLAYLVWLQPAPTRSTSVVSRPQILVSELDIIGRIDNIDGNKVIGEKVLYPESAAKNLEGKTISITNLEQCRPVPIDSPTPPLDYRGPGQYLVPLAKLTEGEYAVVHIPPSPGFPRFAPSDKFAPPRIYPISPEILSQYHSSPKPTK